jgi:hypothetical protein
VSVSESMSSGSGQENTARPRVVNPHVTWIVGVFCAPMLFYLLTLVIEMIEQAAGRMPLRSVPRLFGFGFMFALFYGPYLAGIGLIIGLTAIANDWTDERGRKVIGRLLFAAGAGVVIMWVTGH